MKHFIRIFLVMLFTVSLMGCLGLVPNTIKSIGQHPISKDSPNALIKGMVVDSLKGNKYYYATGECTLYWNGLPQGNIVNSFAIIVNEQTGQVIRIYILQIMGKGESESHTYSSATLSLGEVMGYVSIDDIHPVDTLEHAKEQVIQFSVQ